MEILAVIPARSGSKSVKNKNIRIINDKPMLAYSIEHAKKSRYVSRVIVSTDSSKYAEIAMKYGADVPFLRPMQYATDSSLDFEVFYHALKYLADYEEYKPDIVVHLRPTYPVRNPQDIDNMIKLLIEDPEADSIRCITPAKECAYKMWRKTDSGVITPLLTDIVEAYNMPRQILPQIYYQNGCIDVIRTETIMRKHSMSGQKILGYCMTQNFDIDTEEEFQNASIYLQLISGKSRFVFDIDGVIAKYREDLDYSKAGPDQEMISIINRLYDRGNYIVLFTARGYTTGIDWRSVTEHQLKEWGIKFHELKFGKPDASFYIDDKMLSIETLKKYTKDL